MASSCFYVCLPADFGMQNGQDRLVDGLLKGMTGGFFVESGAFNGRIFSNSLFLERERGWNGLLVEADPITHKDLMEKSCRNVSAIHACLSPSKEPAVLTFRVADVLGGLVDQLSTNQVQRIKAEYAQEPHKVWDQKVPCWPLVNMLQALGVSRVDYWSLDTEGSEAAILASTDFDAIDIRLLTVEVNDDKALAAVTAVMSKRPEYRMVDRSGGDLVYLKTPVK